MVRAGRTTARLATRIPVGAAVEVGRARGRHSRHRAPADAAARAFLAGAFRQGHGCRGAEDDAGSARATLSVSSVTHNLPLLSFLLLSDFTRRCDPSPLEHLTCQAVVFWGLSSGVEPWPSNR